MKPRFITRILTVALFAAVAVMPGMNVSAAIPCQELPVIEPPPDMVVPMIYIQLPVDVEAAIGHGQTADRTGATDLDNDVAESVTTAAENQFRCLNYGMDIEFIGNATPEHRVQMFARPSIEADVEQYIEVDSVYLERLGNPIGLADGRYLIDFGIIVDGTHYLTGELIFSLEGYELYLDGSALTDIIELNNEPITIELSANFTREVKIVQTTEGDRVKFANQDEDGHAEIVITNDRGETVFEGRATGTMLVGGENRNIFVIHDLEPGEYAVNITFSPDDVTYGATIIVEDSGTATPVASPDATPQN